MEQLHYHNVSGLKNHPKLSPKLPTASANHNLDKSFPVILCLCSNISFINSYKTKTKTKPKPHIQIHVYVLDNQTEPPAHSAALHSSIKYS